TLEDVGQLFIVVLMARDDRALREEDLREHHALPGDELAADLVGDLLLRHVGPTMEGAGGGARVDGGHGRQRWRDTASRRVRPSSQCKVAMRRARRARALATEHHRA